MSVLSPRSGPTSALARIKERQAQHKEMIKQANMSPGEKAAAKAAQDKAKEK